MLTLAVPFPPPVAAALVMCDSGGWENVSIHTYIHLTIAHISCQVKQKGGRGVVNGESERVWWCVRKNTSAWLMTDMRVLY